MTAPADYLPELDSREWPHVTYQLDGMLFGDVDAFGCWWIVQKTTGWKNRPGMRNTRAERADGFGSTRSKSWAKERVVTLKGICKTPDSPARLAAEDRFNAMCADGGATYQLLATDQAGRQRTADVELEGDQDLTSTNETTLEFLVTVASVDPRKHAAGWQERLATAPAVASQGLDFTDPGLSFAAPGLNFGVPVPPATARLANHGTAPIFPLLELRGPAPNPVITGQVAGWSMTADYEVAGGETVWINCDPFPQRGVPGRSVISDRRGNLRSVFGRIDWPGIDRGGTEQIALRTSAPSAAEMVVAVRSAWW